MRLILLCFCLLIFNFSYGQQTLKVYVKSDQEAIAFATIQIQQTKEGGLTNEQGIFELENSPSPPFKIKVSATGYQPKSIAVIKMNELENGLVITLQQNSNHLDQVVITGTMRKTYVKDSPVKVDVVTSKKLETYLPTASSSLIENVSLVNGVQEVVACGVCYTNEIRINGLEGQYTAILMDGSPIYGNLASVYGLNGIPNMIIDRFEVIKGPSSTLYGSEAVAGVINIITKDPENEPDISADIMATSHLESYGNISATPQIGNTHGFIGVNYAYQNNFDDINEDSFGDGILMDRLSVFSKWDLNRKSDKQFTIAGKFYFEDRRNGVKEYVEDRNYYDLRGDDEIYGESVYTNRAELFGSYDFNSKENIKLDYSYSYHNQDSYYGSDAYSAVQNIGFANFSWQKEFRNHRLISGTSFRYSAYDDNTIATQIQENGTVKNNPDNQFIPGIYLQDEWAVNEKFTLLTGSRLDHYEKHGLILAPRLSAKYNAGDNTTIRTNFGTGFRVVNLFTEDHAFVTGQRSVEITEDLQPEKSLNGSLNINQEYRNKHLGTGNVELDAYYTYFSNKINPNYDVANKIIYDNSNGNAVTKGAGFNLTHNFRFPVGLNLGMNWQEATQRENGEVSAIEFAPRFSSVATLNYWWDKADITFGYTANYTGRMALPKVFELNDQGQLQSEPRPQMSKPFSIHTLQATKTMKSNWDIYGGVQNLTNFRQRNSPLAGINDPNQPIGFSEYFDTSYAYAPNHGREVYLGIKWNLKD